VQRLAEADRRDAYLVLRLWVTRGDNPVDPRVDRLHEELARVHVDTADAERVGPLVLVDVRPPAAASRHG
jgi:hypothetical protein